MCTRSFRGSMYFHLITLCALCVCFPNLLAVIIVGLAILGAPVNILITLLGVYHILLRLPL